MCRGTFYIHHRLLSFGWIIRSSILLFGGHKILYCQFLSWCFCFVKESSRIRSEGFFWVTLEYPLYRLFLKMCKLLTRIRNIPLVEEISINKSLKMKWNLCQIRVFSSFDLTSQINCKLDLLRPLNMIADTRIPLLSIVKENWNLINPAINRLSNRISKYPVQLINKVNCK